MAKTEDEACRLLSEPRFTSTPTKSTESHEDLSQIEVARVSPVPEEVDAEQLREEINRQAELKRLAQRVLKKWRRPVNPLFISFDCLSEDLIRNLLKMAIDLEPYGTIISKTVVVSEAVMPNDQKWMILSGIRELMHTLAQFPLQSKFDFAKIHKKFGLLGKSGEWLRFEAFLKHISSQSVTSVSGCKEGEMVWEGLPLITACGPNTLVEFLMVLLTKSLGNNILRSSLCARAMQMFPSSIEVFLKPIMKHDNKDYSGQDNTVQALIGGMSGTTDKIISEKLQCPLLRLSRHIGEEQVEYLQEMVSENASEVCVIDKCRNISGLMGVIFTESGVDRLITDKLAYTVVDVFSELYPVLTEEDLIFWLGMAVFLEENEVDAFGIVVQDQHSTVYKMIAAWLDRIRVKDTDKAVMGGVDLQAIKIVLEYSTMFNVERFDVKRPRENTAAVIVDYLHHDSSQILCKAIDGLGQHTTVTRYYEQDGAVTAHVVAANKTSGDLLAEGVVEVDTPGGKSIVGASWMDKITKQYPIDADKYFSSSGGECLELVGLSRATRKMVDAVDCNQQPKLIIGKLCY